MKASKIECDFKASHALTHAIGDEGNRSAECFSGRLGPLLRGEV